ncbi:cilia- and flagella-associated protein 70 isoform X2 [Ambystoma mexicanum]|uniref:cilia- and flagella-associated protein 70 isoform X2 n=1 Tax=Ambystoma mexicanum TaxID=8296 RepID=UPI0037E952A2
MSIILDAAQAEKKPRSLGLVQITVLRGIGLKAAKADSSLSYVRLEFNNIQLGDSPRQELSVDQPIEYNYTASFECSADGPVSLDDIAYKPVMLTVIGVLPKEKKQKEEKTVVLAQATLGLLRLLQGETNFQLVVPLHSIPSSPLDISRPDKPSLEVAVSVPESLLSKTQLSNGNLLKVTLEGAYSVPESWIPTGPQYNYVVSLQVPAIGEKENPIVFSNGTLKLGGEKEPTPRPKKWSTSNIQVSGALCIPDSFITGAPYEEENGELNRKEDKDHRTEAETVKKRVIWDMERCCYIDPGAVITLQKRITESRFWPLEIMRVPVASAAKGKGGKADKLDEEIPIAFHGVAFLNLVPLLYPGVKRIRGAFRVFAYNESEVLAKTKCQSSVMRDILRRGSLASRLGVAPPAASSPHGKTAPGKTKDDKSTKDSARKMSVATKASESVVPDPETPVVVNIEGQQYTDSETYIVLDLLLDKALVSKRDPEDLAKRVEELIPVRPPLTRRSAGAKKAESDYHNQIVSITNTILDEYRVLFGHQVAAETVLDSQTLEEQKCQLNYELNLSGKYFAFKEQLKHAVVKIVREKYMKTTAFEDPDKLQAFLSELYVYLVDQMHVAMNQTLSDDSVCPPPPSFLDSKQLRHFAREAEINENFEQAAAYHQERLARDRQSIEHWLDYGIFNLLTEDNIKARECIQEAMLLDQKNLNSVLLCGIVSVLLEHYAEAEIFFEDATSIDPTSIEAWTLLGLFCEIQDDDIQMDMAFQEASKLRQWQIDTERASALDIASKESDDADKLSDGALEASPKTLLAALTDGSLTSRQVGEPTPASLSGTAQEPTPGMIPESHSTTQIAKHPSIFMQTAHFLLRLNAVQLARQALAHELLSQDGGPSCEYYLALAQTYLMKKEFAEAEENLTAAGQINYQNPDVWAMTGHLHFLRWNKSEAKACYERTVSFESDATETHPVFLRLGSIYLQEGEYEKAKEIYLRACRTSPSCLTWLGTGIACYRLGSLEEAEAALSEANTLNNSDAVVWGYLALVCLKTGRQLEAEQSYKYMMKLNLQDETLLKEVHEMQELVGFGNPSF